MVADSVTLTAACRISDVSEMAFFISRFANNVKWGPMTSKSEFGCRIEPPEENEIG
jgi:hypothetical protein